MCVYQGCDISGISKRVPVATQLNLRSPISSKFIVEHKSAKCSPNKGEFILNLMLALNKGGGRGGGEVCAD